MIQPRCLILASLMAFSCGAFAQQVAPPPAAPTANLTDAQRQQVNSMFGKSNDVARQLDAEQKRHMQVVSQRWRGEPLFNEIVNHPNCKVFKDRVVTVSKNREFNYEVASALQGIRQQAGIAGCIPRQTYQQGGR